MKLRILLISSVLTTTVILTVPTMATAESPFEHAVTKIGESGDIVGLAVAVVRKGQVSSLNTFGVREFGFPQTINALTKFRIASLSKTFAATATGKLVDEGELSLDSSISNFNQDFSLHDPAQVKSTTLTDVLSHRLSLPPYAYDNLLEAGVTPTKILREMRKVEPICRVGTCYAYQNVGFNLITSAIESVTKQSYETVVTDTLLTPLGMNRTSFGMSNLKSDENWARSHKRIARNIDGSNSWRTRPVKQPYYDLPAAGGMNASISDMAKWLAAHMGYAPETLPRDQLRALQQPIVATPAELRRNRRLKSLSTAHYGLGWRIYQYADQAVINHSGSVEGYTAQIAFLPERDVGIVLLANSHSRKFWDILPLFLDYELGLKNDFLQKSELN